jgi:hypothetical protein
MTTIPPAGHPGKETAKNQSRARTRATRRTRRLVSRRLTGRHLSGRRRDGVTAAALTAVAWSAADAVSAASLAAVWAASSAAANGRLNRDLVRARPQCPKPVGRRLVNSLFGRRHSRRRLVHRRRDCRRRARWRFTTVARKAGDLNKGEALWPPPHPPRSPAPPHRSTTLPDLLRSCFRTGRAADSEVPCWTSSTACLRAARDERE